MNQKDQVSLGLKKARSLIDTVIRMVDEDRYCVDIMQQNLAAIGLLKSAQEKLMKNHLETCFIEGIKTGDKTKQDTLISEIETVMHMGNK